MSRVRFAVAFLFTVLFACHADAAGLRRRNMLNRVNGRICGEVLDYTANHGADRRIWSAALGEYRDMYVYLPPNFNPHQRYPLLIYLHGFTQDEQYFLEYQAEPIDKAICAGKLPPVIIAVPDGSILGRPSFFRSASFFTNSNAGNFEDYLMKDVWCFLHQQFPIRPEREAHVISGASMGGSAAYTLAIKYRSCIKSVVGIFPALNLRWTDCCGRYRGNFDPNCWGWRTEPRRWEVAGRFYGVFTVRFKTLVDPLFGKGPDVAARVSAINPIELIDRYQLKPGELDMYVGYGGRDEFNIDAQVESFIYFARTRGISMTVAYLRDGRHNLRTGLDLLPSAIRWLKPRLAPYSPPLVLVPRR